MICGPAAIELKLTDINLYQLLTIMSTLNTVINITVIALEENIGI